MKEFPHYVAMPIQEVMANPSEFIIPENRRAIEYLWDMNILTTQTNDYRNEDSWISIGELSDENREIFWRLRNMQNFLDPNKPGINCHHGVGFRVPVRPGSKDTFEDFLPLFGLLQYQDVQRDGYLTVEEFYCNYTDCFVMVRNPALDLEPKAEDYDDIYEYGKAYSKFLREHRNVNSPYVKAFDPSKTTKSLEEYLEENNLLDCYSPEEGRVYLNKRLYDNHMKYKEQMGIQKI